MTVTASPLVATGYAAGAETTIHTASGKGAIIDKVSAYSAAGGTLTLKIVPSGGSVGAAHVLASKTFAAGESYHFPEIAGHVLGPGDMLSELAAAPGTVVRRVSGRLLT